MLRVMAIFFWFLIEIHLSSTDDEHKNKCVPRFHYFQPFYGKVPPKAFLAATDDNGENKYVARIVSPDQRTWSAPTTFSTSGIWNYFGWEGETDNRVSKFIELLMVEYDRSGFGWRRIRTRKDVFNMFDNCCFVQGGYGYKDGKRYTAYVGRFFDNGVYFIGGFYLDDWYNRTVLHYMDGWESKFVEKNYAVLVYDCCKEVLCENPPCCNKFRKGIKNTETAKLIYQSLNSDDYSFNLKFN